MNRKLILVPVVFLILIALLIFIIQAFTNQKSNENRGSYKVTANIQYETIKKDGIYYFTGSFFAKYDFKKNSIIRLSDYLYLQNTIDSLDWYDNSVLFRGDISQQNSDDLARIATTNSYASLNNTWWIYNFTQKNYTLIDTTHNCNFMKFTEIDKLICVENNESSSAIYKLDLKKKSSEKLGEIKSTNIWNMQLFKDQLYYSTGSERSKTLNVFSIEDGKNYKVYDSGKNAYISSFISVDGRHSLIMEAGFDEHSDEDHLHDTEAPINQTLVYLDAKTNMVIASEAFSTQSGNLFIDSDNKLSYYSLDGSIRKIIDNKIQTVYSAVKDPNYSLRAMFDNNKTIYSINSDNDLLNSDKNRIQQSRNSIDFRPQEDNNNNPNRAFWIEKQPLDNNSTVFVYTNDSFKTISTQLDKQLKDSGFEPSEFIFSWETNAGAGGINNIEVTDKSQYIKIK